MNTNDLKYKINNQIRASELRVISADGKQIGVMKLSEALSKAKEENLDLIEVAPNASPPVAKIMNFGKFKYEEEKKLKKEKRGIKGGDTKELRFTPFIGEADYQTRLERIKEFIADKDKVRIVVKFGFRQMGSKEFGYNIIKRIADDMGDLVSLDSDPKFLGRNLLAVFSPKSQSSKKVISK